MSELSSGSITQLLFLFGFPFIFGYIATKLRLPSVVGYVLSGVVLGSVISTSSLTSVNAIAQVGLLLLLFTIGLDLDLRVFRDFRAHVVGGGLMQLGICWAFFFVCALIFRFPLGESILLSVAFAFSSTAVVSKIIQEKGEDSTLPGRLSMGVLILQDLAAIPILVLLESIVPGQTAAGTLGAIGMSILRSGCIIAFVLFIGLRFAPRVFGRVALFPRDLSNLFTVLVIFGLIGLFELFGLSATLAAFLAGILVGQTVQHHTAFSQFRPLRDLFSIVFFAMLGMSVSISGLLANAPRILIFALIIVVAKMVLISVLFARLKIHSRSALYIGILLSQVGEFAFLIIQRGYVAGIMSEQSFVFSSGVTIVTLILSPSLIYNKQTVYLKLRRLIRKTLPGLDSYIKNRVDRDHTHIEGLEVSDHVVICGYGRVGGYIGRALTLAQIDFIVIDTDYDVVLKARDTGITAIYGDPTDIDILEYARCSEAEILISAVPTITDQETIILNAKLLNKEIYIFGRVEHEGEQRRLKDLGAHVMIQPEFEAALSIVRKIYSAHRLSKESMVGKIQRLKLEHGMM